MPPEPDPIDAALANFGRTQAWLAAEIESLKRTRAYLPEAFVQRKGRELQGRWAQAKREFDRWHAAHQ